MKSLVCSALLLASTAGCGPSSVEPAPTPNLVGPIWQSVGDDAAFIFRGSWTFNADGTYEEQNLELTSATSADEEIQIGTYVLNVNTGLPFGGTITLTPKLSTCPGPYVTYPIQYVFNGQTLNMETGPISGEYKVDTQPALQVTLGCGLSTGNFQPLAFTRVGVTLEQPSIE